jgi:hypothetical protein
MDVHYRLGERGRMGGSNCHICGSVGGIVPKSVHWMAESTPITGLFQAEGTGLSKDTIAGASSGARRFIA